LGQGQIFTHRFDTTGSFKYHCTFHANMTGTIVVQ
jgi:plastocyanin